MSPILPDKLNSPLDSSSRTETDQLRELERRLSTLTKRVAEVEGTPIISQTPDIIPALVNLADNTDFIFSDQDYNGSATYTYVDDEDVLAQWYARAQATATAFTENTGA